jgi:hypothetical protein
MKAPEHEHEHDQTGLERRLASWLPATTALDRDRMLFEAGRASALAEPSGNAWPAAAVALALLLAGLGGLFAREHSRRVALETVLAARPPVQAPAPVFAATPPRVAPPGPAPSAERPGPSSYFVLTTRLTAGEGELDFPPVFRKPSAEDPPGETRPRPPTLRPRGFERVLDL